MKAVKYFLVLFVSIISFSGIAQESSRDENSTYEYYKEDNDQENQSTQQSDMQNQGSSLSDRVFFGGGFGASFGDYIFISVSPIIGYRISDRLSAGLRMMYQYTTFEYYVSPLDKERYNGHDFGAGPFARYMIYGPVYLQAEYEYLNYNALYTDGTNRRTSFDSFMAGGGLAQPIGRNAAFFMTILYNFSYQNFDKTGVFRHPYNSPWVFRIGIAAGF
jgi:hypothetical protein